MGDGTWGRKKRDDARYIENFFFPSNLSQYSIPKSDAYCLSFMPDIFSKSRYYNCRYLEFQLLLDSSRYSILGVYFYTFVFNIRYFDVQYFNRYISTFRVFAVLISISRYFSVRTLDFGSFFFPRFAGRKRSGTRFKPFPHTGSLSLSLHFSLCSSSILHGPLFAYFTPIRCRRLRVAT